MIQFYLEIVKPGIIIGNIILLLGSFLFASHSHIDYSILFPTLLGSIFVIASSCIFNNLLDRKLDQNMHRTRNRVLVKGKLKPKNALIFALILGFLGFIILGFLVNVLTMFLAIFGFLVYVILYSYIYKRTSIHSTLIGSFSGSIPSSIGYTAVSNTVDLCFVLLFIVIIFWQMSHFYSISIFRINDYKNAKIPVLSVVKGIFFTRKYIIFYILLFICTTSMFSFFGVLSYIFLFLSLAMNIFWLYLSLLSLNKIDKNTYARQLFYFSIIVIIWFNFLISIDYYL